MKAEKEREERFNQRTSLGEILAGVLFMCRIAQYGKEISSLTTEFEKNSFLFRR